MAAEVAHVLPATSMGGPVSCGADGLGLGRFDLGERRKVSAASAFDWGSRRSNKAVRQSALRYQLPSCWQIWLGYLKVMPRAAQVLMDYYDLETLLSGSEMFSKGCKW